MLFYHFRIAGLRLPLHRNPAHGGHTAGLPPNRGPPLVVVLIAQLAGVKPKQKLRKRVRFFKQSPNGATYEF